MTGATSLTWADILSLLYKSVTKEKVSSDDLSTMIDSSKHSR